MRLFDKVASQRRGVAGLWGDDIICLQIDEIVDHYHLRYASSDGFVRDDFPFAISPWKNVFVEWDRPYTGQQGFLCMDFGRDELCGIAGLSGNLIVSFAWLAGRVWESPHILRQDTDASGGLVGTSVFNNPHGNGMVDDFSSGTKNSHNALAAMAFTFANCSNVKLEDRTEEYQPSAKIMRRLKLPCVKRYTLNIDGHSTAPRPNSEPGQTGIMPFHLCRGHFATYTEDKPRFGRLAGGVGRFWIRPHTRGREERGIIEKDYAISGASE